ncbi:DNA cytosine methyltransferase [Akkermansiaceae bacterium]|nr:DNA cytosine methyltransferase [Akkermansiaceae bacterium]
MKDILGIDLFAGAGGLSLGAEAAGIRVSQAVENNPSAAETFRRNHPVTKLLEGDVRSFTPEPKRRTTTILFGGPPCQGFSTANQRTRNFQNPGNWLFQEVLRCARVASPEWVLLENVKGLRGTAEGQFERLIIDGLEELEYNTTVWTLCAADYGVPQMRSRVFIIGRKKKPVPPPPIPTVKLHVTVREAISDLPNLTVGANINELPYGRRRPSDYAIEMRESLRKTTGHLVTANNSTVIKRYAHIPPGGNWTDIPSRLMKNYTNLKDNRSRHSGIYRRLVWDSPSVVIANYRKNMLVHPDQDRGLSVREAARIQSFPDRFVFHGSIGTQQQQVSNAVPPLLAKVVFKQLINHR